MTQVTSIAAGKTYNVAQVCRVWRVSRASVYRKPSAKLPGLIPFTT